MVGKRKGEEGEEEYYWRGGERGEKEGEIEVRWGVRAFTPSYRPYCCYVGGGGEGEGGGGGKGGGGEKEGGLWVYTGLGSKGLLYHSFYANKLALSVLTGCALEFDGK